MGVTDSGIGVARSRRGVTDWGAGVIYWGVGAADSAESVGWVLGVRLLLLLRRLAARERRQERLQRVSLIHQRVADDVERLRVGRVVPAHLQELARAAQREGDVAQGMTQVRA